MRGGVISHFGFLPPVRLSVSCFRGYYWPWMLHTTMFLGFACNSLGTYFNLLVWGFGVSLMKTLMEHYLDYLCPVLHFSATNFQEPGCHVI